MSSNRKKFCNATSVRGNFLSVKTPISGPPALSLRRSHFEQPRHYRDRVPFFFRSPRYIGSRYEVCEDRARTFYKRVPGGRFSVRIKTLVSRAARGALGEINGAPRRFSRSTPYPCSPRQAASFILLSSFLFFLFLQPPPPQLYRLYPLSVCSLRFSSRFSRDVAELCVDARVFLLLFPLIFSLSLSFFLF